MVAKGGAAEALTARNSPAARGCVKNPTARTGNFRSLPKYGRNTCIPDRTSLRDAVANQETLKEPAENFFRAP